MNFHPCFFVIESLHDKTNELTSKDSKQPGYLSEQICVFTGHTVAQITGTSPAIRIRKFYKRKIVIIFLPFNLNMCFGCSKVPSH